MQIQTSVMMFITVGLEAFVSPNDLMLKAPSSRELETCRRAIKRPKAQTKRILGQRGQKRHICNEIRGAEQASHLKLYILSFQTVIAYINSKYVLNCRKCMQLNMQPGSVSSFGVTVGVRDRRDTCEPGHMIT